MANHIYATAEFTDINRVDWKITIRKMTSAADSATTFYLGSDGFVITHENDDEYDVLTPIMGSTCEFTMMYDDGDRTRFENMYTDILSGEDGLFCVEVHRQPDGSNDLWWRGYILPEAIVVEDIKPYERVTIRAVDGLGALDGVDMEGLSGNTIKVIVNHCLNELPYTELYGSTDTFTTFVDDFLASNLWNYTTDYSASLSSYDWMKVDEATFYNYDNDGTAQYFSCKTVLETICKTYNLRLYQSGGVFYLMPLGALQEGANIVGAHYTTSGSTNGTSDVELNVSYGTSQNLTKMRGWVQTAIPPHGEIKVTRDYQGDKAIVSRANLDLGTEIFDEGATYEAGQRFRISANFLYRFTGISSGNTDNNRYGRILMKVKLQIGNDNATPSNNYYINRPYSIGTTSYIHASGDQYDNDFANTLELGADAYGAIEWTSDQTDRYNLVLPFIIDRENGTGQTLQDGYYLNKQINFVTPEIPADKVKVWLTIEAVGIEADGTTNSDYLNTTYADYQLRNVKVQYTSGTQEEEFGTVEIKATANGRYDVDLDSTLIGDRIATENLGIIKVIDIGATYAESTDWRSRQSTTSSLSINKLAVNERMGFFQNGKVIQRGTLLSTAAQTYLTPHTIVRDADNSFDYFVSMLRFVANAAQYDVSLIRDGRTISGITLAQDNSKPSKDVTADDTGNVNTPMNIKGDDIITNVVYNYNKRARQNFTSTWSGVIGTETKEMYWTVTNDGQGKYVDHQGETPAVGKQIERVVYVQTKGLQTAADSGWQTPTAVQPAANDTLADTIALMQDYMSKVGDHGSYTFMVSYKETDVFSGILDTYTTASAGYSTRRLTASYTGSLLRVRRADGTEQDIGYDADGHLDESAISTFAGGTACTVATWYDQSGNGNDLTNTNVSAQPQIYDGTVFYSIGTGTPARKALNFSSDYLQATADLHAGAFYATSAVVTGSTIGNLHIFNQDDSLAGGTARIGQYLRTGSANNTARSVVFNTSGTSTADNTANNTVAANTAYVISAHGKSSQIEAFVDDVSNGHTSLTGPLRHGSGLYRLGANAHTTTPGGLWNGRIAEVLFFDEDMSGGHQTGVVNDISTYFTI